MEGTSPGNHIFWSRLYNRKQIYVYIVLSGDLSNICNNEIDILKVQTNRGERIVTNNNRKKWNGGRLDRNITSLFPIHFGKINTMLPWATMYQDRTNKVFSTSLVIGSRPIQIHNKWYTTLRLFSTWWQSVLHAIPVEDHWEISFLRAYIFTQIVFSFTEDQQVLTLPVHHTRLD